MHNQDVCRAHNLRLDPGNLSVRVGALPDISWAKSGITKFVPIGLFIFLKTQGYIDNISQMKKMHAVTKDFPPLSGLSPPAVELNEGAPPPVRNAQFRVLRVIPLG